VKRDVVRRWISTIVVWLCGLSVVVALVPLAFILFFVVSQGVQALNWEFFTALPAPVGELGGGFSNAIVGTLMLVGIGAAFAVPVGIISGVYIAEFPATKLATMARFAADTLNGVPSIVVGVFVYGIAVMPFKQFSAIAGGISLGVMMIPIVTRTTEELLKLVPPALREGEPAGAQRRRQPGVCLGTGDDGDARVVLGGGADHRRAADVDLLDALLWGRARGDGVAERVEVGDDEVERLDAELLELPHVVRVVGVGEDPRVHRRVEGLDPTVETLGEARELLDRGHRNPLRRNGLRGRPGRHDGDAGVVEGRRELGEPGLVVHGDERTPDRAPPVGGVGRAHGMVTFRSVTVNPSRTMRPTRSTSWGRSAALIRSVRRSTVSSSSTGTATWPTMTPVSMPSSTTKRVAPVTLTP